MGPDHVAGGSNDHPKRPRFSWDMKTAPWTDGKGDQDEYASAVALWQAFHDKLPDSNSNKIPKELRGIILMSNLFGRAKDLCKKIPDQEIQSDTGVDAIVKAIYKRDPLSAVSTVYQDFLTVLGTKRGASESFRNFESRFTANVSKFNSHSTSFVLIEAIAAFMLLANSGVDSNQRVSVLAAATPHSAQFKNGATTSDFLEAVSYDTVASVLRQCDKMKSSESSQSYTVTASSTQAPIRHKIKSKRSLTPEQLADLKSKSQCKRCNQYGHWRSDHNEDGSLKPGVKSFPAPNSSKSTLKKTVTFNLATVSDPLSVASCDFIGPLCDDGAPYSGLGQCELNILRSVLLPNWDGVLDPIPDKLASRPFWQYGVGDHASQAKPILGSVLLQAVTDDGVPVSIRHLVIEGSSQWIIGRNVTRNVDIIHSNGNCLKLKNGSIITLIDHDLHSYVPYSSFCTRDIDTATEKMLFCATASIPSSHSKRPWAELKKIIDKVHTHVCGHASFSDMKVLLQRNGLWSDEVFRYLAHRVDTCSNCLHTAEPKIPRKVSLSSMSRSFNDVICIDHLHLGNSRVCHVMDATTRYSVGSVVPDVSMEHSIHTIESNWISPFWAPEAIQFDQAFDNAKFQDYLQLYDITPRPIPARRHNKNVLESKHRVIRDIFLRLSDHQENTNEGLLIQQAIRISNDLYGNDVLSAHELAKGYTRPIDKKVVPSLIPDELLKAHEVLIAKRKLNLILRSKPTKDVPLSVGDQVQIFIKLPNEKRGKWSGSRPVLSYDISSGIVTVPGSRGRTISAAIEDVRHAIVDNDLAQKIQEAIDQLSIEVENSLDTDTDTRQLDTNAEISMEDCSDYDDHGDERLTPLPKIGDSIEVLWPLDNEFYPGVVTAIDGGNDYRTVHYKDGDIEKLNMTQETWRYTDPDPASASTVELTSNYDNVIKMFYKRFGHKDFLAYQAEGLPSFPLINAYVDEESKFKDNVRVIDMSEVPRNANVITSHVLYKVKANDDGSMKMKARIAPHGNKDKDRSDLKSDSATCPPTGIRLLLSIAAIKKWP